MATAKKKLSASGEKVPSFDEMLLPTLVALTELGGSGNIGEIYETVAKNMNLSGDILAVPHGDSGRSEVEYRLAWSRTYLKRYGLIDNSARGVWALTDKASETDKLTSSVIVKAYHFGQNEGTEEESNFDPVGQAQGKYDWADDLHKRLLDLPPEGFERLAQRLLRESGFVQVEVTGKSGDGGIDGSGIARINGFLSFTVLFQCKRYQGSVGPGQIRDFRGAMQGRTDKGLFITTGTFSRDAVKEATRDGAPPIDLIDGEALVQRLKELQLGVRIKMVESVEVDREWFAKL